MSNGRKQSANPRDEAPATAECTAGASLRLSAVDVREELEGKSRRRVLRFVGGFTAALVFILGVSYLPFFERQLIGPSLEWSASIGSWILNLFGFDTSATGRFIASDAFSVEVRRGCDAYEPSALYLSALLAFPAPWRRKLTGALWGVSLLVMLNLVRITTLFWIGVRWPSAFELFHVDVWQTTFIIVSLALWLVWAVRVTQPAEAKLGAVP